MQKVRTINATATAFIWGPSLASRLIPGYTGVVNDMFAFEVACLILDLKERDALICPSRL